MAEADVTDIKVLMGAILHDTVEDTDTTLDELEEHFGAEVRTIVAECSDDKSLPKEERKRLQIEHAKSISKRAKLVKLADKLYNLRDLERTLPSGWTEVRTVCTHVPVNQQKTKTKPALINPLVIDMSFFKWFF